MTDIEKLTAIAVRVGAGQSLQEAYHEVVGPTCDWCGAAVVPTLGENREHLYWKHIDGLWSCITGDQVHCAQVDGSNVCKVPA